MANRERVRIFDTTLRDGEQSAGVFFSRAAKLEIASLLDELGVDVIEAGFPTSSAGEFESVASVARSVENAEVCALSRAVEDEIDAAWSAVEAAREPRLHVFLSSSDIHLAHQLRSSRDEVEARIHACVKRARGHTPNVEFSPMDATRTEPAFLARLARTAIAAGASTINIPDTVGCARPDQIHALISGLQAAVPELAGVTLSFHGQNDLGLATANALAAAGAGASQLEVTVNGIDERAGNTSLEEVVMALRVHGDELGLYTDIDPRAISRTSRVVSVLSGLEVAPNKAVVGRNAFRHASGIHQDGVLKHRENYELFDPDEIGHPFGTEIVLGKLSGRRGFAARVEELGIELGRRSLDRAFGRFQALVDVCGEVRDEELRRICACEEAWPGPGV